MTEEPPVWPARSPRFICLRRYPAEAERRDQERQERQLLIQLREYEREEQRKREQAAHGGHAQDRAGAPNKSILPSGWRRMPRAREVQEERDRQGREQQQRLARLEARRSATPTTSERCHAGKLRQN
jgi:hypothetical protein